MAGKLIVLEGLDGSGKATQAKLAAEALLKEGMKVRKISFPNYSSDSWRWFACIWRVSSGAIREM